MKIDSSRQSVILVGESPEADLRFERALRLNGAGESAFSLAVPPFAPGVIAADEVAFVEFPAVDSINPLTNAAPSSSKTAPPFESSRWGRLYRMVTQGESSPSKGRLFDGLA